MAPGRTVPNAERPGCRAADPLIRLGKGCRLRGIAPGNSKVHVFALDRSEAPDLHGEAQADAGGRFEFAQVLEPGEYLVHALATGPEQDRAWGWWRWFEARVAIRLDDHQGPLVRLRTCWAAGLRGKPREHWRKGRFRPAGKGPWVEVPLTKGAFEVRGLPPGRYDVHGIGEVEVKAGRVTDTAR